MRLGACRVPRIPLPRTWVNRLGCSYEPVHFTVSSTFCALGKKASNSAVGLSMPMVTVLPLVRRRPIGVPEEGYHLGGEILAYDVVELHTLGPAYGGGLRFVGVEEGVMLEPADHILGGFYHLWAGARLVVVVDLLDVPEDQDRGFLSPP